MATVFVVLVHIGITAQAQRADLPAPRPALVPLHWPDLAQMEPEVQDQIKSYQDTLVATVKDTRSSDTNLSDAYGALGEIYHAYSLNAPARECYLNAGQLAPKDFRWVYLLAKLDQLEGRTDEAIRRYRIAGSLQPDLTAVPVNLGNIYLELDRLEEAKMSFALALHQEPKNTAAHYGLGQVALSKRSYAEAVEHFEKALTLMPGANRIHYPLAMAYRGLGNSEKAKIHLAQQGTVGVRVTDPLMDRLRELVEGARVHLIRGKMALEAKRYQEAAAEFRKALNARPDSVTAHVNLGATLTQLGDLKGAAEHFSKALVNDPNNVNAHYNLAVLLANDNQPQQAIIHLQAVTKINPTDSSARLFLARQLSLANRKTEALAELSQLVQADPNNEDALLEQVQLLQQGGLFKEALSALEKSHAQYPQKVRTAEVLAYLLATSPQLNLREGTRSLKLAQSLYAATGSLPHGAIVGLALAELGRCQEARAWQTKMLQRAVAENNENLQMRLRADLRRSENVQSCRP